MGPFHRMKDEGLKSTNAPVFHRRCTSAPDATRLRLMTRLGSVGSRTARSSSLSLEPLTRRCQGVKVQPGPGTLVHLQPQLHKRGLKLRTQEVAGVQDPNQRSQTPPPPARLQPPPAASSLPGQNESPSGHTATLRAGDAHSCGMKARLVFTWLTARLTD